MPTQAVDIGCWESSTAWNHTSAVPVAYTQKIISHGRICWANEKPPNWAPELYGRPLKS
jgi:hypothetical protein